MTKLYNTLLEEFTDSILSVTVQYFDGSLDEDPESEIETVEIEFRQGLLEPSIFVEVPAEMAQAFVDSTPRQRDQVYQYITSRYSSIHA